MEKFKKDVLDFYNDKQRFIKSMIYVVVGILFYLGVFMTFIKDPQLINGKVSLSQLPGSFVFEFVIFVSIFGFLYTVIIKKDVLARRILLVQVIFATLFHLYGALLFRVGSEGAASGGFGRLFTFFFLVIMWVIYVKHNLLESFVIGFTSAKKEE